MKNNANNSKKMKCSLILRFAFYILHLISLLPFRALYVLSDILFVPVFYLMRYRRKMVWKNLRNSFPHKPDKEIRRIEKEFYHHFCDLLLETIKIPRMSVAEIQQRMRLENPEVLQNLIDRNCNVSAYLGHYGNWEWCSGLWAYYTQTATPVNIYRKLKNPYFDGYFLGLRSHFGAVNVEKDSILRSVLRLQKEGKPVVLALVSDQKPSPNNIHYRTMFLNRQTPVLTGAERIARTLDHAVVYLEVTKIKRGFYSAKFIPITEHAKETPEFKITEIYTRLLENTILRNPAYWLWTHNRWKHK